MQQHNTQHFTEWMDDMSTVVQLSLGRNVGIMPMVIDVWDEFKTQAAGALIAAGLAENGVEIHLGTGKWVDDAGRNIYEESAHITTFVDKPKDQLVWELTALVEELQELAHRYEQDAIAVNVSESILARPVAPVEVAA